jgi:hypothetical protein
LQRLSARALPWQQCRRSDVMRETGPRYVGGLAYAKPLPRMLDFNPRKEYGFWLDVCDRMAFTELPG